MYKTAPDIQSKIMVDKGKTMSDTRQRVYQLFFIDLTTFCCL